VLKRSIIIVFRFMIYVLFWLHSTLVDFWFDLQINFWHDLHRCAGLSASAELLVSFAVVMSTDALGRHCCCSRQQRSLMQQQQLFIAADVTAQYSWTTYRTHLFSCWFSHAFIAGASSSSGGGGMKARCLLPVVKACAPLRQSPIDFTSWTAFLFG